MTGPKGAGGPEDIIALEATYWDDLGLVWIQLSNLCVFGFPPHLVKGLDCAPKSSLAEVVVLGGGCGLRWPDLDVDLSVSGLLMGSFGARQGAQPGEVWWVAIAGDMALSSCQVLRFTGRVVWLVHEGLPRVFRLDDVDFVERIAPTQEPGE